MWKEARNMNIDIIYPPINKRHAGRQDLMVYCKWAFLFAGLICAVVNLSTGGKAWSIIVIWSMRLVWSQLVSPDMVEYNRISQTIKLIVNACILLALIEWLLVPGWAAEVVPIVCFFTLILVGILFFTDFQTQRQNMFPMLFFCVVCLIGSIIGLLARPVESWPLAVMGAVALSLLIGCAAKLGKDFLKECQKRFCIK